jgi:hypothetical protein
MSRGRFRLNELALGATALIAGVALIAAACGGGTSEKDKTATAAARGGTAPAATAAATKSAATSPATKVATPAAGATSKASSTPAAPSAAPTSSSATKAAAGATAAAPVSTTAATSDGGACPYLSDADAATLLPNAGQPTVTAAGKVTTCQWGADPVTDVILLTVSTTDADLADAKTAIDIREKINGLGDSGAFMDLASDSVAVQFIKGETAVWLSVGTTVVNADALVAVAKKIAAKL